MERRRFLGGTLGLLAAPLTAEAQPTGRVWRIGYLGGTPSGAATRRFLDAFLEGLRDLGYAEGQNIAIEYRSDDGDPRKVPQLAAELVRLRVDVLVTSTNPRAVVVKNATTTIPIVVVNVADPIEIGLVASLAHPGGNVTGLTRVDSELIGKNLELLAEAVPGLRRAALLSDPANPAHSKTVARAKQAAAAIGLHLYTTEVHEPRDLQGAFSRLARDHVGAVLLVAGGVLFTERARVADLALRRRLPSMAASSEYSAAGGLMSYAPDSVAPYRRAGVYLDKIFKGARPGDLPLEQPTKFELVINLKTAKALGLTIPPSVLARADQVIE